MRTRFLGWGLVVLTLVLAIVSPSIDPSLGGVSSAGPPRAFYEQPSEETSTAASVENITTGSRINGSFPNGIRLDDGVFVSYEEGNDPMRAEIGYRSNTGTNAVSSPKTRSWDGSTWGGETELAMAGSPIRAVRIAWSATSPGTKVIVTQSDDGWLDGYVCTTTCTVTNDIGRTWSTAPAQDRKLFDVAYEQASGEALLVYSVVSTDTTRDIAYATYVGGAWSAESYVDDTGHATDVQYGALKVASRVGSDQIGLVAKDNTNDDVNAWIWDGAAFGNFVELTASAATGSSFEPVAVAWESSSGHLIAATRGGTPDILSKEFTTAWSGVSTSPCGATSAYYLNLKPNPAGDDMLMVAASNSSLNFGTCYWTGSAWTNGMTHDSDIDGPSDRPVDFAWEDTGSKGLLVWGTTAGQITYRTYTATNTWGSITDVAMGSNTHPWVQLRTNPTTQTGAVKVLGAVMDTANNLGSVRWDGTTLTVIGAPTFTADVGTTSWESFELEYQAKADDRLVVRHDWTGVPAGDAYALKVKGYRDTEDVEVQVLTPPVTWTTVRTISATTSTLYTYNLTSAEYNGGAPSVRFVDTNVDGTQANLFLDLAVIDVAVAIPQIVVPVQDFERPEDSAPWSTNLSGLAYDEDTPLQSLQWNTSGVDPGVLQVGGIHTPGNHVLTFYPQPDAWGSMRVTYWLSDPEGNAAWWEAWINITPVNDAPRFSPPPPASLVVKHDLEYVFDFTPYIADVDDPLSSLALASNDPTHANASGLAISFLFPVSYVDQWAFVGLLVSDGNASAGKVVAVKVTRDDPPVVTRALPDVTMEEGETIVGVFDLDGYFTDPNNDTLFFSYGYSHLTITIQTNHSVDIAAESNWFGAQAVTFRGTDQYGALAEDTIVVTVLPLDDPPVLGPVPDLRVRYDSNYTFDIEPYLSDPDTALDTIVVTTSSLYVTVSGRSLTLLYPFALNNTVQNLTIQASDGTSTAARTIRVTVGDDWPPVLTIKLGDRALLEDGTILGAYDLGTSFFDPDGGTLYFSSGNVNVLVSINPSGIVNLSAVRDWFGAERVTFRARDTLGALAEDHVWITVLPVNDAPSFRTIPTQYLNETAGFLDLTPFLFDVDTNVSDLVLTNSSANVTVVGQSLVFHYRADGDERLEIVASDGLLEARAFVEVVVRLPRTTERLPPILWWLLGVGGVATAVVLAAWRYRRVEWVFLVSNGGLLLASVSRRESESVDSDLMAAMMTAILDFAKASFSDEKVGELDELSFGDRRVELVRGKHGYLATIYTGRTPGRLEHIMKSLLDHIEERHPGAFGTMVDTTEFQEIPVLLARFMHRSWWPVLSFGGRTSRRTRS